MRRLFDTIASLLISRAVRYPYWHLTHADGSDYMNRYWLMPRFMLKRRSALDRMGVDLIHWYELRWRWLPAIRIHHIRSSDCDRALHDHPWTSRSIILSGSYMEVTPRHQAQHPSYDLMEGGVWRHWRRAGDVVVRRATDRHRLVIADGFTCWSLFVMGRKEREWGFHTASGWVHHKDYFTRAA